MMVLIILDEITWERESTTTWLQMTWWRGESWPSWRLDASRHSSLVTRLDTRINVRRSPALLEANTCTIGSAMATLDRLNLFKVDAFVVGSSEMCKTWCHLEIFTWLQSSSLYLCKPGVNDWRKKTIQPLSKNPSQLWCCFQLKGRGVAFWGEVETPGWRRDQNQEKLISNLPE